MKQALAPGPLQRRLGHPRAIRLLGGEHPSIGTHHPLYPPRFSPRPFSPPPHPPIPPPPPPPPPPSPPRPVSTRLGCGLADITPPFRSLPGPAPETNTSAP